MKTVLTSSVQEAAAVIRRGDLVAFPTETVYGLGANVFDEGAIRRIFEAKERPPDNPLIIHIGAKEQVWDLAKEVPAQAMKLMEAFFPGPLTVVLARKETVPSIAAADLDTIGVRMPRHPLAAEFLRACGVPVAAPSANISGRPSPTTWQAVLEDLDGRIDCILQGEATEIGIESTVVDCTSDFPVVLRPGSVSLEDLQKIVPRIRVNIGDVGPAASPGMRHRHYSPAAEVLLVAANSPIPDPDKAAYIGITVPAFEAGSMLICSSVDDYARKVFSFFRECERAGIKKIYCQEVPEKGIGAALMDRLRRAAAG